MLARAQVGASGGELVYKHGAASAYVIVPAPGEGAVAVPVESAGEPDERD